MRSMAKPSRHFSLSLEHMLEMKVRKVQQLFPPNERLQIGPMHRSARVPSSWGAGFIARTEHQAHAFRRHEATAQRNGRFCRSRLLGHAPTVVLVPPCLAVALPVFQRLIVVVSRAAWNRRAEASGAIFKTLRAHRRNVFSSAIHITGIDGCERPPRFRPNGRKGIWSALRLQRVALPFLVT